MAVFGTPGHDTMTINGNLFTLNGLTSTNPNNNSIYSGAGNDTIIVKNKPGTAPIDVHGESGNDIILVSARNNGAPSGITSSLAPGLCDGPSVLTTATTQYISGGVGSDIMAAFHACDANYIQTNVFLGDTRLFSDPVTGKLASDCNTGSCSDHKHSSGKNVFLEGGHDLVHGTPNNSDMNILELRGYGWFIRLDNGNVLTAADVINGDINLSTVKSGIVIANLMGSSNSTENGLYTISFDNINKIHFTDGGIGGSNTSLGLTNSTTTIPNITATSIGNNSTGKVIFGQNNNSTISGTSKDDVIYGGNGNKTINGNGGDDTFIAGNGNEKLNGGSGHDVFVFRSDVNTALNNTYTVKGAGGDNWVDLSGLGKNAHIHLSNGTDLNVNTLTDQAVLNIASGVTGTITSGNVTINFDQISKVIY
ncbi:MAG: hypothetical protein K2X98_04810 [Alphaproteobacteria bacterium]|nr:hypothetical protein [Alphaproteobacteria bacterium]